MELNTHIKHFIATEMVGQPHLHIGDDDDLLLSGLVDSLGVVRLIAFLEEETGVSIPAGEITIENFGTVNAMVAYLGAKAISG